MDEELRERERRAQAGEPGALEALLAARLRSGALTPLQRRLSEQPLALSPEGWAGELAREGLPLLLAADLELCRCAAPRLAAALPPRAELEPLLQALDAALGPAPAAGLDLEGPLKAARLRRVEDLRLAPAAQLLEETARGAAALLRGDPLGAERHARSAAERGARALGQEEARDAARRGALRCSLRPGLAEEEREPPPTPEALLGRWQAGELRLADLALAAYAGDAAALALFKARQAPFSPQTLAEWLTRLEATWGPDPLAHGLLAMARALGLDPALARELDLPAPLDPARARAALTGIGTRGGPGPGLAAEALRARLGEAVLPRVMARIREGGARQADLRAVAAGALAAWALAPGTRFPGLGPAWMTVGDRSRARSEAFRAHVLEVGGPGDDGLVTEAQLGRLRALSEGLAPERLRDLLTQAGATAPGRLSRDHASWLIDHLAPERPRGRRSRKAAAAAEPPGRWASAPQLATLKRLLEQTGTPRGVAGLPADLGELTWDQADAAIGRLRERP